MAELERHLAEAARSCSRAIVVTDGVFSMRGDHAPLERIRELVDRFDAAFAENVLLVVDDSHGVGALGQTGRGTEEVTRPAPPTCSWQRSARRSASTAATSSAVRPSFAILRETSPFYIYSNPITPAEAAAALAAIEIVDGPEGTRCSGTCAQ